MKFKSYLKENYEGMLLYLALIAWITYCLVTTY